MTQAQIIDIQRKLGVLPDGFWGPISRRACEEYLLSLMPDGVPRKKELRKVYGEPGEENLIYLDVTGMGLGYLGTPVTKLRCHKRIAEHIVAPLRYVAEHYPDIAMQHGGCYQYRKKRGAKSLSMHAWGIAIDLDPKNNGMHTLWPQRAKMPFGIIEAFARAGFVSGGAFWGYDAMHFERIRE